MTSPRADVLILGSGIAGCALAYHLARRGAGRVVLYDPSTPGAGATGRAAGIVTEQLWNPWDVAVTRESRTEYADLAAHGDPSAITTNGFVRWTVEPAAAAVLSEAAERLRGWGVDVVAVPPSELADRLPEVRWDDVRGTLYTPRDAVVTPSSIGSLYADRARAMGVEPVWGEGYRSLHRDGDHWALTTTARSVAARAVVVAAGAWSKRVFADAGAPQPLAPYRTQAALLRPKAAGRTVFPSVHDIDLDVYARPEANGRVLAGDGTEPFETDPDRASLSADDRFLDHLAHSFGVRFPGWQDAELVRAWAGVCTSTPDRRPMVGPVPGADGLHALVGFNGFGVMRAGGVARRLADLLLADGADGSAREALAPVLPARFPPGTPSVPPRPGFTLEAGDAPRF